MRFKLLVYHQINNTTVTTYFGHIGTGYTTVLCVENGEIVCIGELLYRIWREGLGSDDLLIEFGKACERFRTGQISYMPRLCFQEDSTLGISYF
jgi:hypothetical protein